MKLQCWKRWSGLPSVAVPLLIAGTALAHEPPSGLLAHLPLDGSVGDAAGFGYDGEYVERGGGLSTAAPVFREGRLGQALYLDGEHGVRIPLDLAPEAYPQVTVTAWVYAEPDSSVGSGDVFSNGTSLRIFLNGRETALQAPGNTLRVDYGIRPGRWVFVAGTVDSATGVAQFQVDRRKESTEIDPAGYTTPHRDVWFGTRDDRVHNNVKEVRLDDLRVYGRVLSDEELEGLALGQPTRSSTQMITSEQGGDPQAFPGDQFDPQAFPGDQFETQAFPGDQFERGEDPTSFPGDQFDQRTFPGDQFDAQRSGSLSGAEIQEGLQTTVSSGQISSGSTDLEQSLEEGRDRAALTADMQSSTDAVSSSSSTLTSAEVGSSGEIVGLSLGVTYTVSPLSGSSGNASAIIDLVGIPVKAVRVENKGKLRPIPCEAAVASEAIDPSLFDAIQVSGSNARSEFSPGDCSPVMVGMHDDGEQESIISDYPAGYYLQSLRVCQRSSNGRVKGMQTSAVRVVADTTTNRVRFLDVDTREVAMSNCESWAGRTASCGDSKVASGIRLRYNEMNDEGLAEIVGMELICRSVKPVLR